jgi:hypothetical protein
MSLDHFLNLDEEYQFKFLVHGPSSLDELVTFVSLASMLHQCIEYNVLRRAMDVWDSRLNTDTRTMTDDERKQFEKLRGITIQMKFIGSFSRTYNIEPNRIMAKKQELDYPTKKQIRRKALRRQSLEKKNGFQMDLPIC